MKTYSLIFFLTGCFLPQMGLCQEVRQQSMSLRVDGLRLEHKGPHVQHLMFEKADASASRLVAVNGVLRLKELASCENLKDTELVLSRHDVIPGISRIDGADIAKLFEDQTLISDHMLSHLLMTSSSRMNWYLIKGIGTYPVEGTSRLSQLNPAAGLMVSETLFDQLAATDQAGVIVHESLRILFATLNLDVTSHEVEDITCRSLAGEKLDFRRYPILNEYLKTMKVFGEAREKTKIQKLAPF